MFPFSSRSNPGRIQRRLSLPFAGAGVLLASVAVAAVALPAASAPAALVSTGACDGSTLTEPFAQWGDTAPYKLAPGGDFEGSPSGWTLTSGAKQVAGSEPYGVTGTVGSSSLALPAGASAQSPYSCVNASYPSFRLFARNDGSLATVLVQVVYKTLLGPVALPLGAIAPGGSWQPTPPILTGSVVAGALSGGTAQVALRFTALTGASNIDDVEIDPRMR